MTTINLYQNQEEAQRKVSSRTANGGFFFSLGILVLTIVALFGIRFYIASLIKENKTLAESVTQQNQTLAGVNSLQRILDMQTRLNQIKDNLQIKNGKVEQVRTTQVLDSLAGEMSSGVVISSFKLEENKVNVSFETKNYNEAARQILNFKKSVRFSDATVMNISRGERNISVNMTMEAIKNTAN